MGENSVDELAKTDSNGSVPAQTGDDYQFLQEKIKERPINKRKLVKQSITTVLLAVVFGLVACITFMLLEPVIGKWMTPKVKEENIKVIFPEEKNEMLPENMVLDDDELNSGLSQQDMEEVQSNIANAIATYEIQVSDYQLLYDKMYGVVDKVSKSMVKVRQTSADTDWFLNSTQNNKTSYGLIVADNGTDLFVLTNTKAVSGQGEIMLTFCDGVQINASLVASDTDTGFSICSIPLNVIPEDTMNRMQYAVLGSSNSTGLLGDVIIAVGSPMGYEDSVGYGVITSVGNEINSLDYNYKLLTTDIYGSGNAVGVIANMSGQVIAVIDQSHNTKDMSNLVSGVGISELKKLIEKLSNEEPINHLGVYVTDVTYSAKEIGIPNGAYVTNVKLDTPAMLNGIKKGDVIVAINDVLIGSVREYEAELRELESNQDITVTIMRQNADGYSELNIKTKIY